jgi:hypothetical protein
MKRYMLLLFVFLALTACVSDENGPPADFTVLLTPWVHRTF